MDEKALLPVILECGRVALTAQKNLHIELKADQTLVTQADKEVEALLTAALHRDYPGVPVLGEETSTAQEKDFFLQTLTGPCFVIDPIDGTAPYANGLPNWGVSLGWVLDGQPQKGIIYVAGMGELYFTFQGQSWFVEVDDPAGTPRLRGEPQALPPAPETVPVTKMVGLSQSTGRRGEVHLDHPFQMTGSSVYSLAKTAGRCYGGYLAKLSLWDFAAGWPLLTNLGYVVERQSRPGVLKTVKDVLTGQGVNPWSTTEALIFAPPSLVPTLRSGVDEGRHKIRSSL